MSLIIYPKMTLQKVATDILYVLINLVWMSTAREKVSIVVAMQGDVQHIWVIVEGLLGAVAMMHILDSDLRAGQYVTNGCRYLSMIVL